MQVSRSDYYMWRNRPLSQREKANAERTEQIKMAFAENRETYGSPRLFLELKGKAVACSEKRVARLMRLADLKATLLRRFVITTDSRHARPVAEDVLAREFACDTPATRLSGDITYVWTGEGWLYLAVILALFSRRIVGWAMGTTLQRSLVLSALAMALQNRHSKTGEDPPRLPSVGRAEAGRCAFTCRSGAQHRLHPAQQRHLSLSMPPRARARRQATLVWGRFLVGSVYNFCTEPQSLRQEKPAGKRKWAQRTPVMAAGLTDYC